MKKVFALVIVVLLLAAMATPMALATDGVTIVPNATYHGETVTMTAKSCLGTRWASLSSL